MAVTGHFEEARDLAWAANAYLDCAMRLCESLVDDEYQDSTHHFRVPLHLAYLAIELYMKAGILLGGQRYAPTHDLNELQKQFDEVNLGIALPIPSYLDQFIPKAADLFIEDPALTSSRHFERFRYYADRRGNPFPELEIADLRELKRELEELHRAAWKILMSVWPKQAGP